MVDIPITSYDSNCLIYEFLFNKTEWKFKLRCAICKNNMFYDNNNFICNIDNNCENEIIRAGICKCKPEYTF